MSLRTGVGGVRASFLRGLVVMGVSLGMAPGEGAAQEAGRSTVRTEAVEGVSRALEKERGLSPDTIAALEELMRVLKEERPAGSTLVPAALTQDRGGVEARGKEKTPWEKFADRLTPYGDFRLREEYTFRRDDKPDRNRVRVRFRFGVNLQVSEELQVGVRVRTGDPDDPNSPHQTLGSVFNSFELNLDRAFVTYAPAWAPGFRITGGKFAHPFYRNPVYGELIMDGDVQPAGGAAGYVYEGDGRLQKAEAWVGEYILEEQDLAKEALLTVLQGAAHFGITDAVVGHAAVGYYHYHDPDPDRSVAIAGDNDGNTVILRDTMPPVGIFDEADFVAQFGILNPIVAATYDGWFVPVTVSGEYINNVRPGTAGRNQGWAVGFSLGRRKRQGDWRCFYQFAVVEQDAVFSAFANDDYHLQTNRRGHVFGGTYQVLDNVGLRAWGIVQQRDHRDRSDPNKDSEKAQWRARADINIKF